MGIIIVLLGLVMGSFLGALTYRMPRNVGINEGRSRCPKCKKQIAWYDNIPVLSYLLLGGKCRHCHKEISLRYPIIELLAAITFFLVYVFRSNLMINLPWVPESIILSLIILLTLSFFMLAILVIDAEHQIIPDVFVYLIWGIVVGCMIFGGFTPIYAHIAAGFVAALFLLLINLATKGKGMGLGDVKLAIAIGTMLGPLLTIVWYFLSFIIGGIYGTLLLASHKAKMRDKVAFGPFLIVSFFIVIALGDRLVNILFPYF